jgi:hypothetical protein
VSVISSNNGSEYQLSITVTENPDTIYVGQEFDLVSKILMAELDATLIPVSVSSNSSFRVSELFQLIWLLYPNMDKDTLLSEDNLANAVNEIWQRFTAILFSTTQRIPVSDGDDHRIMAQISGMRRRLTVSERTTRIMQGLLGILTLCMAICAYLSCGADQILYQPPYTIASLICLVEGSKLPQVVQQAYEDLPEGEVMTERGLKKALENYIVRFGWFTQENGRQRYGVEIFSKGCEAI